MCLIIHKPNPLDRVPALTLSNAERINPDGFSILYLDDGELYKTMEYTEIDTLLDVNRPYIVHYRYATRGKIGVKHCHPYTIKKDTHLFSNGTVGNLGDKNTCDTHIVANILHGIPHKYWENVLSLTETRFAIAHPNLRIERHGEWHERDGIFYSKDNCFAQRTAAGYNWNGAYESGCYEDAWDDYDQYGPANALDTPSDDTPDCRDYDYTDWLDVSHVAVYGTLKQGRGNHWLLQDSEFVGKGKTANKFPMICESIPFVYDEIGKGHNIHVEVYDITDPTVAYDIDNLENHPDWYERRLVNIQLATGDHVTAWMYLQPANTRNMQTKLSSCF